MSSLIAIGFLDRTRVCIRTEFTPPLADDERRELLIHAALLTGRAFASLPWERQRSLAGVLRQWSAERFVSCPIQIVPGDPSTCAQRFASTFLAPVREYALASFIGEGGAESMEYYLPMACVAWLRSLASEAEHDELLKPALALCSAAAIHPITVTNHFQMASASLPKVAPIIDRTPSEHSENAAMVPRKESRRRVLGTRRSLIVSACVAALIIMATVHYLSTREASTPPAPFAGMAGTDEKVQYLHTARELAEGSLAQLEALVAAAERPPEKVGEALEPGMAKLKALERQFSVLQPPPTLVGTHREISELLQECHEISQALRDAQMKPTALLKKRLSDIHLRLEQALNKAQAA